MRYTYGGYVLDDMHTEPQYSATQRSYLTEQCVRIIGYTDFVMFENFDVCQHIVIIMVPSKQARASLLRRDKKAGGGPHPRCRRGADSYQLRHPTFVCGKTGLPKRTFRVADNEAETSFFAAVVTRR